MAVEVRTVVEVRNPISIWWISRIQLMISWLYAAFCFIRWNKWLCRMFCGGQGVKNVLRWMMSPTFFQRSYLRFRMPHSPWYSCICHYKRTLLDGIIILQISYNYVSYAALPESGHCFLQRTDGYSCTFMCSVNITKMFRRMLQICGHRSRASFRCINWRGGGQCRSKNWIRNGK
jgi:hypothetical protein